MIALLSKYSMAEIIILAFMIILAIKECITLYDFFKNKTKEVYDDEASQKKESEKIIEQLNNLDEKMSNIADRQSEIEHKLNDQQDKLVLLTKSDKDQLKSFIVREYHYFCEQKGWIDDFSMDSIERCFEHYVEEGGNSYIHDLMNELAKLPHHPQK